MSLDYSSLYKYKTILSSFYYFQLYYIFLRQAVWWWQFCTSCHNDIVESVLMYCNLLSLQEDEVGGIDPIMRVWNLDKVCFLIFLNYTL